MVDTKDIDFSPLATFYKFFRLLLWLKRLQMILVRLAIVVGLGILFYLALTSDSHSEGSISFSLDGLLVLALSLPIVSWVLRLVVLSIFWEKFRTVNNFISTNEMERIGIEGLDYRINSFSKLFSISLNAVSMDLGGRRLLMTPSIYKEGGIVRWREYKLDLIIRIDTPEKVRLPHIIADSAPRDAFKLSNLHKHYRNYEVFYAEAEAGKQYRLLAKKQHQNAALVLLTPDVLSVMLEKLPGVDVEFSDNQIWFVCRHFKMTEPALRQIIEGVLAVAPELDKQIASYA